MSPGVNFFVCRCEHNSKGELILHYYSCRTGLFPLVVGQYLPQGQSSASLYSPRTITLSNNFQRLFLLWKTPTDVYSFLLILYRECDVLVHLLLQQISSQGQQEVESSCTHLLKDYWNGREMVPTVLHCFTSVNTRAHIGSFSILKQNRKLIY